MNLEKETSQQSKKIMEYENKLVSIELESREKDETISKLKTIIKNANIDIHNIKDVNVQDELVVLIKFKLL